MKISSESINPSDRLFVTDLTRTLIYPDPSVPVQYRQAALSFASSEQVPSVDLINHRFSIAFEKVTLPPGELRYGTTSSEGLWFWKRILGSVFPRFDSATLTQLTGKLFKKFSSMEAWTLFPDAQNVLLKLRNKDIRLGLLSNFDARGPRLIDNMQVSELFDEIVFSAEVGHEKPDRRIFRALLRKFSCSFEQVYMLGDRPETDLKTPESMGWATILFDPDASVDSENRVSGWEEVNKFVLNG